MSMKMRKKMKFSEMILIGVDRMRIGMRTAQNRLTERSALVYIRMVRVKSVYKIR